jgi:CheY-like chemotaxis protein
MTEETQSRCLEPFITTKGERGTGLELAMAYGMVQRHSAEIQVESVPRKGTTVSLIFPGAIAARSPAVQRAAPPGSAPSLRILVVDDDSRVLKSLRRILEADGNQVTVADGGQAGIDSFIAAGQRGEPFAVVLSDLGMPDVDGRKLAAAIKATSPDTPIVLVTGRGHTMRADDNLRLHVDCVLSKPPDVEELRRAIVELTAGR